MNTNSDRTAGFWAQATVAALFLVTLGFGETAWSGSSDALCIRDAANFDQGNICTANDVRIGSYELIGGPTSCFQGDEIQVDLRAKIVSGPERYDIGVWVDQQGGNAQDRGNLCYRDYLQPLHDDRCNLDTNLCTIGGNACSTDADCISDVNLASGVGPYYNAETDDTADICGDLPAASQWPRPGDYYVDPDGITDMSNLQTFYEFTATITCRDDDGDGQVDVGTCTSWDNQVSSNDAGTCGNDFPLNPELETAPGTSSKCNCGSVNIAGLEFQLDATIEVIKDLEPALDTGVFDLQIDGLTEFEDAGDGDKTGPIIVTAGTNVTPGDTHSVGEVRR